MTNQIRCATCVLAIVSLAWPLAAYSLPIPIESSLDLVARANIGAGDVIDQDTDSQGSTIDPLAASALVTLSGSKASATVFASASAYWDSPAEGIVNFSSLGWNVTTQPPGEALVELPDGTGFTYTFQADATGFFRLAYDVTGSATDFGNPSNVGPTGFSIDWAIGAGPLTQVAVANVGTSEELLLSITSGEQYSIGIGPGILSNFGGFHSIEAEMRGVFQFTIDCSPFPGGGETEGCFPGPFPFPVPEPSTLMLMGIGLVGLGWMGRRRRKNL